LDAEQPAAGPLDANKIEILSDQGIDLEKLTADFERTLLTKALQQTGGIKKRAAKLLGISFRSMRYRVDKYSLGALSVDDEDDLVAESSGQA
jgi:two-component system response regulator PilR (NtrC family)